MVFRRYAHPLVFAPPTLRLVSFQGKNFEKHAAIPEKPELEIRTDHDFEAVIRHCGAIRREGQDGTWITADMKQAYLRLHQMGHAHSIETYIHGELVGGLYGVRTGNVFCGESMFSLQPNASKAALITLCTQHPYSLIDCQVHTPHLESLGAEFISREEYLRYLRNPG